MKFLLWLKGRSLANLDPMAHILFGLAIISASLQTAWALYADGLMLPLPVAAMIVFIGWRYVKNGSQVVAKVL